VIDNPFIQIDRVDKSYPQRRGEILVIKDVSMSVEQGKILCLIGPSGCGKSTLLRILAGLTLPSTGSVKIDGKSPLSYQKAGNTGFIFQKATLFPWWTLQENILLPTKIKRDLSVQEQHNRSIELIDMLGLNGFEDAYPRQLSGGMLQRAAIARAMMLQPQLLLLDEPFSALDELTRESLWLEFNQIWRSQNLTVVIVTHNITEAVFFADRIMVMSAHPGTIQASIEIPLPPKRQLSTIDTPEFTSLCQQVRRHIHQC
jgi:NitT/TauT family transport system ATP-binding protein